MAKPLTFENGQKYWGLTKPEDYVVLDAIDRVMRYVPKTDPRWFGIKQFFLDGGKPLWDLDLITINDHLKRKGWSPIVLTEGHSDSHSILRGPKKAQIRDAILRQLRGLDDQERADVIAKMHREIAKQPERDVVIDARKELRADQGAPSSKIAETLKRAVAMGVLRTESEPVPESVPEIATDVAPTPPVRPPVMSKEEVLDLAHEAAKTPEARRNQIAAFERIEHQKGVKNSQFGRTWITKNGESKRVAKDELGTWFQLGWKAGRTMKTTASPVQDKDTMSQKIELSERVEVDDVERALKERRDRNAQPSRAEYDALKAEVGVLRTDLSRLMRLVVDFAQR